MSEPKVQLLDPQGNINLPGLNATGVITASSFSGGGGVVTGLTANANLNVGVVTATSFVGDGTGHAANLTGTPNLNLGLTTATSFIGDAVGKAAGLTGTPNLNVGLVTATSFAGAVTGDVTGNISGLAASVTSGVNLNVGVVTAIQWHGNGANLTGAGSSAYIAQEITTYDAETIIDLSDGNLIYYKGKANTTVGFASTSPAEQITFIRDTSPTFSDAYNVSYSTGGVTLDGTDDYLSLAATTDFQWSGDFTAECWFKIDALSGQDGIFNLGAYNVTGGFEFLIQSTGTILFYSSNGSNTTTRMTSATGIVVAGQWHHTALVRYGSTVSMYLDGVSRGSYTDSTTFGAGSNNSLVIGAGYNGSYMEYFDGVMSNVRIVKGTAVYTSDFLPPSAALTNITNTKLLCCQSDSSTTTAAVSPGTITANSSPTAGAQTVAASGTNTFSNGTITWPNTVKWSNNNVAPTLLEKSGGFQIIRFTTANTGATYYGWSGAESPEGNRLFMWGSNTYGMLGQNDTTTRSSPTQVGSEYTWKALAQQHKHTAATKTDGTLWSWGYNNSGNLGQNDRTYRSSPVQIPGTTWNRPFLVGNNNTAATRTDGTLWTWGQNNGTLGHNNNTFYSSPVQLPGTTWSELSSSSGGLNVIARKTDGTLWGWGSNSYGGLGHNNTTGYSSPKQIGTNTTWKEGFGTGYGSFAAVKTDGTLWTCGMNNQGELGQNAVGTPARRSSPIQVGTDTDWSRVSGAVQTFMAIKTNGALWTWGNNSYGMLGLNNATVEYSSPVQVGTDTTWAYVEPINYAFIAGKTDGTLWTWGYNSPAAKGQLGQNDTDMRSSPTQIPGTWDISKLTSSYNNQTTGAFKL